MCLEQFPGDAVTNNLISKQWQCLPSWAGVNITWAHAQLHMHAMPNGTLNSHISYDTVLTGHRWWSVYHIISYILWHPVILTGHRWWWQSVLRSHSHCLVRRSLPTPRTTRCLVVGPAHQTTLHTSHCTHDNTTSLSLSWLMSPLTVHMTIPHHCHCHDCYCSEGDCQWQCTNYRQWLDKNSSTWLEEQQGTSPRRTSIWLFIGLSNNFTIAFIVTTLSSQLIQLHKIHSPC